MLVPKESSVLAFFPTLNPREKNPRCSLSFRDDWQDRWTFAFIYYNNRFFGGTRNEYRLTRMTDFLRRRNAKPGDTIILTRDENDSYRITIERFAQEQPLGGIGTMVGDRVAGIPGRPQADAAEPSTARDQVRILDTWHTGGLRGTGSHDFEVSDAFVPEGRSVLLGAKPRCAGPLYRFPVFGLLALGVCAVTLGISRRALDELVALAGAKLPSGSSRNLASRPVVQRQVGEAEAALRSARAYVYGAVDAAWQIASRGESLPLETRADLRLAAVNAAWSAARAVDLAYHAAGGTSVYDASPLSRCFRDIHVATQHIMVAQPIFEVVGRVTLGLPTERGSL